MIYLLLKTAHIVAMVAWLSGMVVAALALARPADAFRESARTWDRNVTAPAMLLTWALGLVMAGIYGWFGGPWLWAKIFLVTVLSAYHGVLAGRLRRAENSRGRQPDPIARAFLAIILPLLLAIVFLVEAKPF